MKKNKMSMMSLIESDIFQKNLALKALADQELPMYVQTFSKQIREDKYQEALATMGKIAETAQRIQQEMQKTMANTQLQQSQQNSQKISNSEV